MAIRFRCNNCNRLLRVGGRKKGATIGCPRCGRPNIVPESSTAQLRRAAALASSDSSDSSNSGINNVIYEDVDSLISDGNFRKRSGDAQWRADEPPRRKHASRTARREESDSAGMAGWLFIQAVVLLVVLTIGMLIGYLVGRGSANDSAAKASAIKVDPGVVVWGRLFYHDTTGRTRPDDGALVVAFPNNYRGKPELKAEVLWVVDGGGDVLKGIGGIAQRTAEDGTYSIRLPKPGKYHLFLISGHSERSKGELSKRDAIAALSRYVSDGAELLQDRRYAYRIGQFEGAQARTELDFDA